MPIFTHASIVQSVLEKLTYDRDNVAWKGKDFAEEVREAVKIIDAEEAIARTKDVQSEAKEVVPTIRHPQAELKALYEKVGMYYLFHKRDKDNALKYLHAYRLLLFGESNASDERASLQYAEACNFVGYAETITGSFVNKALFEEAAQACLALLPVEDSSILNSLRLPQTLPFIQKPTDTATINKLKFNLAFALRYIGLFHHRKNEHQQAQNHFVLANKLFNQVVQGPNIESAECLHLLGVSLTKEKRYREALQQLAIAYALETNYVDENGNHFMVLVTVQSIADTNRKLAEDKATDKNEATKLLAQAKELLEKAEAAQIEFYGTDKNEDVAKTKQFLGENYLSSGNYSAAISKLQETLKLKLELFKNKLDEPMILFALEPLAKAFNQDFDFDWNNYKTHASAKQKIQVMKEDVDKIIAMRAKINKSAQLELANLCYKMGCFYNHVDRDPITALKYQVIAEEIFNQHYPAAAEEKTSATPDQAWLRAHMAFSFQQIRFKGKSYPQCLQNPVLLDFAERLFSSQIMATKRRQGTLDADDVNYAANHYWKLSKQSNNYLQFPEQREDVEQIKIRAFTLCVKALVYYENDQLNAGVECYRSALNLYEKFGLLDDQYARAKCRYAQMLSEQAKPLEDPGVIFSSLQKYWDEHPDKNNPYRKRFEDANRQYHANVRVNAVQVRDVIALRQRSGLLTSAAVVAPVSSAPTDPQHLKSVSLMTK